MKRSGPYCLFILLSIAIMGCTGMKHVRPEDSMYLGSDIKFENRKGKVKSLSIKARSVLKPKPNNKFLWMRPAVARYHMISDSARTRKFWKSRIKEPVLLSVTRPLLVRSAIQNRMFQNGYFQSKVEFDTIQVGKRKAKYRYRITLNQPWVYDSITFPASSDDLSQKILQTQQNSLLKKGFPYSLDDVKKERGRIDRQLKENGHIFFNPEFLILKADSINGNHSINARIEVKPETPPESRKSYFINNIYIHDDYSLGETATDTLQIDNHYLISKNKNLNFSALDNGIFLEPGQVYRYSDHIQTIRYLNDLPVIRNASIRFQKTDTLGQLDAMIFLSQRKRFAYTAELNTIFRSTNYFGPGVIFSYSDRNLNRGSELLKINLRGRFEMQISEDNFSPAYELGVELNYTLPRFYPSLLKKLGKSSLPKTNISVGYNLFNRLDLYRLNSVFTNFGYRWSRNDRLSHSLNPVEIIFTQIPESSKSEEFNDYLMENPGVARSFDEQFVVGMGYEITYTAEPRSNREFFIRGGVDFSGNILGGIYSAIDAEQDSLGRYTLLGVPYSQYMRARLDLRYGFDLNQHTSLVTRFIAGVGIPYGNSDIIPYIKQFYVGGTNSLRSFVARSVGPGSEVPPGGFNDLTGDIRLEWNLEYRFDISGSLKGALFLDAGNVWLYNEDPTRPDGDFNFDTFLEDMAISSGWGLRWDFDFLVARLDFAYTLRTPYLPEGERWIDDFNIFKPTLSIAIGYPF